MNLVLSLANIGTMVVLALVAMRPFNRPWYRARDLVYTWASVVGAAAISILWRDLEPKGTMGFGVSVALLGTLLARAVPPKDARRPAWHRAATRTQAAIQWFEVLTAATASALWLVLALSRRSGTLPGIIGWFLTLSSYGALAVETIRYRPRAAARGAREG